MVKSLMYIGLLITFVGVGVTIFVFKSADGLGTDSYKAYIVVDNANGLLVDTEVRIAGVKVGRIDKLELINGRAKITLEIRNDIILHSEDTIQRVPQGVLGSTFLEIQLTNEGYEIKDGEQIPNANGNSFLDTLGSDAGEIVGNVSDISTEINNYLTDSQFFEKLNQVMLNLSQTLYNLNKITEGLVLDSQANTDNVRILIASLASISNSLELFLASDKTSDNQELSDTLRSIKLSLKNIEQITQKVNEGEGTLGKLVTSDSLYVKADSALDDINKISSRAAGLYTDFEYNYAGLISESSNSFASKNTFNVRIAPANSPRYYKVGITTGGTEAFSTIPFASTIATSTLKLNLEIAHTFKNILTIHGGLIENTGGVGIILQPIPQISVASDFYNFSGGFGLAQLRAYATVYPFFDPADQNNPLKWIFFGGGVEDIINSYGTRSYFFNIGIRIRDEFLYDAIRLLPLANSAATLNS